MSDPRGRQAAEHALGEEPRGDYRGTTLFQPARCRSALMVGVPGSPAIAGNPALASLTPAAAPTSLEGTKAALIDRGQLGPTRLRLSGGALAANSHQQPAR